MVGTGWRQSFGQALRCTLVFHLPNDQGVIAHDLVIGQCDVRLRRIGLLALKSMTNQKSIEGLVSAIEFFYCVLAAKLLDSKGCGHASSRCSKTLGFSKSSARRGRGFGGASNAAWKAAH